MFLAGFALGLLRVGIVAPRIGEARAVLAELPLMLALSWAVAGAVLRRSRLPPGRPRLVMGVVAFAALMLAEALLALALGQTLRGFLAGFQRPAGALGLAGQIGFAMVPSVRR